MDTNWLCWCCTVAAAVAVAVAAVLTFLKYLNSRTGRAGSGVVAWDCMLAGTEACRANGKQLHSHTYTTNVPHAGQHRAVAATAAATLAGGMRHGSRWKEVTFCLVIGQVRTAASCNNVTSSMTGPIKCKQCDTHAPTATHTERKCSKRKSKKKK